MSINENFDKNCNEAIKEILLIFAEKNLKGYEICALLASLLADFYSISPFDEKQIDDVLARIKKMIIEYREETLNE